MDIASEYGSIKNLEKLKSNGEIKYSKEAMNLASLNGHLRVLDWWVTFGKESGLPLKYSKRAMNLASCYGRFDILNWWFGSGLHLKYGDWLINNASFDNKFAVLEWWINSGLRIKFNERTPLNLFRHNHLFMINYLLKKTWKVFIKNVLKKKIDQRILNQAFIEKNDHKIPYRGTI